MATEGDIDAAAGISESLDTSIRILSARKAASGLREGALASGHSTEWLLQRIRHIALEIGSPNKSAFPEFGDQRFLRLQIDSLGSDLQWSQSQLFHFLAFSPWPQLTRYPRNPLAILGIDSSLSSLLSLSSSYSWWRLHPRTCSEVPRRSKPRRHQAR